MDTRKDDMWLYNKGAFDSRFNGIINEISSQPIQYGFGQTRRKLMQSIQSLVDKIELSKAIFVGYEEDFEWQRCGDFLNIEFKNKTVNSSDLYDSIAFDIPSDVEYVIIVSQDYEKHLFRKTWNVKRDPCAIINIYDYFSCQKITLAGSVSQYISGAGRCRIKHMALRLTNHKLMKRTRIYLESIFFPRVSSLEIFYYRKMLDAENPIITRSYYIQQLIYAYLAIRDIKGAKRVFEEYPGETVQYRSILDKVQKLHNDLAAAISRDKRHNIILYWIDSVPFREYQEQAVYSYLKGKEHSVSFTRAYTMMPWTHWTLYTIFRKKRPIDDRMFTFGKMSEEDSVLLREIRQKGYAFKYFGLAGFGEKYFKDKKQVCDKNSQKAAWSTLTISQLLWYASCDLLRGRKSKMILLHELLETHSPFWSPESPVIEYFEHYEGYSDTQKNAAIQYVMDQIEWYEKNVLINENLTKVYFSDHGRFEGSNADDIRVHTFLTIESKLFSRKCSEERVFSYLNFSDLLVLLMEQDMKRYDSLFEGIAYIQNTDFYARKLIDKAIREKWDKKLWLQSRGAYTEKGFLIKYVDGEILTDLEAESDIEELKEAVGSNFINVYEEDKFAETRRLYEMFQIHQ